MELSTKILIEEAKNRNIEVDILDEQDNFIRLKKGNKIEYIKQATKTSLDTYIAPLIMENKLVTKIILKESGFCVPEGVIVKSIEEGEKFWENFAYKATVIKPKNTNFGTGVVILPENNVKEWYIDAIKQALKYDDTVLIEEFISGKEYRFLVMGEEVVGIIHRIPANVIGDGNKTIEELVKEKNKNPLRGEGHTTPFEKIKLGKIELDYLKSQGKDINYIPKEGEIVYLRENSNVSTGGESIDFTDIIGEEYKKIAVDATKAVGAKICGVDMIIKNIDEFPNRGNHSIIELNFNPAIYMHNFPYKGENRHVERKLLDLLGF
ncbi:bifunctional glutamate--cysteine ligase GshA/glutathione synthetase GshB [Defluviitalea phaphyphila]|uniref:bifunctional glutamate--cysteine ligase GshA/glutathione synthetase GshB n=1 Tax=Defluviitalea phaphyphila TaxID=1473580 RepID=UPI000731DC4C|nr:bifunctional glutamate--cysteine ligase GshA/glutathione synthetase GshB [Defluviitalea phaphyphila]